MYPEKDTPTDLEIELEGQNNGWTKDLDPEISPANPPILHEVPDLDEEDKQGDVHLDGEGTNYHDIDRDDLDDGLDGHED